MPREMSDKMSDISGNANLREKVTQVGSDLRNLASTAGDAAREQLQNARDTAADYYERGVDQAYSIEQAVESYIREKPIQAALIAAGVGVALGWILRRR